MRPSGPRWLIGGHSVRIAIDPRSSASVTSYMIRASPHGRSRPVSSKKHPASTRNTATAGGRRRPKARARTEVVIAGVIVARRARSVRAEARRAPRSSALQPGTLRWPLLRAGDVGGDEADCHRVGPGAGQVEREALADV